MIIKAILNSLIANFLRISPKRIFLTLLLLLFVLIYPLYSQTKLDSNKSDSIQHILTKEVNDGKAPGMIAAITSSEGVLAIGSAGERKVGSGIAFTTNDLVHLGSCTKAMTATMIAILVSEGKLSWETKLIEAIPELKDKIHADYHEITMWNLLTHRAGLFKNPSDWGAFKDKGITQRRLALIIKNMASASSFQRGEFHYSNFGYMVAACMAEQITGLSWESLMQQRVFNPLAMYSAGFGAPNTHDQIDQPWGHSSGLSWLGNKWKPDQSDNPEALSPAGRVHCNIEDWAKFLSLFLSTKNPVLDGKYLNKLITPIGFYAGGWGVAEPDWAKGIAITHAGSNGIWYTNVLVLPKLDRAFIVSTNSRDFGITEDICVETLNKLVRMDLKLNNE